MTDPQTTKVISEALTVISKTADLVDLLTAIQVLNTQLLNSEKSQPETVVFSFVMDKLLLATLDLAVEEIFAPQGDAPPNIFGEVPF